MRTDQFSDIIRRSNTQGRSLCFLHRTINGLESQDTTKYIKNLQLNNNIDGFEFDVQATLDNVLIVVHDFGIWNNGKYFEIKRTKYTDLSKMLLDHQCPKLGNFLNLFKNSNKILDIEIKQLGVISKVISICKQAGIYDRVVFTTIYEDVFLEIKAFDNNIACMYGYPRDRGKNIAMQPGTQSLVNVVIFFLNLIMPFILRKILADKKKIYLSFYHKMIDTELVSTIHSHNRFCIGATISLHDDTGANESLKIMEHMLRCKVDIIKTDFPNLFPKAFENSRR